MKTKKTAGDHGVSAVVSSVHWHDKSVGQTELRNSAIRMLMQLAGGTVFCSYNRYSE